MQCLQCWGSCTHPPLYSHAGTVQLINNTPKQTDPRVEQLLEPHELALYNSTTKPGKLCSAMLQALTASAGFTEEKEVYISGMLGQVSSSVSQVSRIKLQAMPYGKCYDKLQCMLH